MAAALEPFDAIDVIAVKRDGEPVPEPELRWFVGAYDRGVVTDAQMAAFAMAVRLNGMGRDEVRVLTSAIIDSGERMDLSGLGKPTIDKHSTGGVGDKITLPLAPLVASFGVAVPQLSGRGLGHTGGTLDKLESIPGWRAELTPAEIRDRLRGTGAVVCAAGSGLAPADKRLYALRDVTGTVESIPLIASSIMSKKLAEGPDALVLDVKFGAGAFMVDPERARELAEAMVSLGEDSGVRTVALLTDMKAPLGRTIGNANEVREAVEVLAGGGPDDVVELTLALAREMLDLAGLPDADPAAALSDGRAMDSWRAMIRDQGGDPDAPLPVPRESHTVRADRAGVVTGLDARSFGVSAWRLGAGRSRPDDAVAHAAGIDLHRVVGDEVSAGDALFTLHADDAARFARALDSLQGAWQIGDAPAGGRPPRVAARIDADGFAPARPAGPDTALPFPPGTE